MKKVSFLIALTLWTFAGIAQNQTTPSPSAFFNPQQPTAKRLSAVESTQVFTEVDLVQKAVQIVENKQEPKEIRVAALQRIVAELPQNDPLTDFSLRAIVDTQEPAELRLAVLEAVQANFFGAPARTFRRAAYTEAMQKNLSDPTEEIRSMSIRILCSLKDPFTIDRLLEGLQKEDLALLPPVEAIHLLSFQPDTRSQMVIHKLVMDSKDKKVKLEAIRMLKQYQAAEPLFASYLQNKEEDLEVRRMAAASLHHRHNKAFATQIKSVIFDKQEDIGLRTFCLNALAHHSLDGLDNNYTSSLKSIANDHQQPKLKEKARKILEQMGIQW